MSGVVPSLLAMPLKLIGRGVLGAVVGWVMVAGRWLVGGLGFWTRLARCAARAAAVSSVAARVDARIRVTFMGLPPSLGSGRRGVPDHCGSSLRTDQAQRGDGAFRRETSAARGGAMVRRTLGFAVALFGTVDGAAQTPGCACLTAGAALLAEQVVGHVTPGVR